MNNKLSKRPKMTMFQFYKQRMLPILDSLGKSKREVNKLISLHFKEQTKEELKNLKSEWKSWLLEESKSKGAATVEDSAMSQDDLDITSISAIVSEAVESELPIEWSEWDLQFMNAINEAGTMYTIPDMDNLAELIPELRTVSPFRQGVSLSQKDQMLGVIGDTNFTIDHDVQGPTQEFCISPTQISNDVEPSGDNQAANPNSRLNKEISNHSEDIIEMKKSFISSISSSENEKDSSSGNTSKILKAKNVNCSPSNKSARDTETKVLKRNKERCTVPTLKLKELCKNHEDTYSQKNSRLSSPCDSVRCDVKSSQVKRKANNESGSKKRLKAKRCKQQKELHSCHPSKLNGGQFLNIGSSCLGNQAPLQLNLEEAIVGLTNKVNSLTNQITILSDVLDSMKCKSNRQITQEADSCANSSDTGGPSNIVGIHTDTDGHVSFTQLNLQIQMLPPMFLCGMQHLLKWSASKHAAQFLHQTFIA
jgi:hypothetical protein